MQKRALAGAGRGHDRNHLTFDKFQVYRSKDNQLRRACSVRFAQSARLKNYAAGCFCQARRHEAARCCCSVSSAHLVVVRLPALSLETRSTLIRLDAEYGGGGHFPAKPGVAGGLPVSPLTVSSRFATTLWRSVTPSTSRDSRMPRQCLARC